MWIHRCLFALLQFLLVVRSTPTGFPSSGNGLWYNKTGVIWSREWLPVGNGYLAATTPGGTTQETVQLNIESLWSGGPFADPNYNGGNKQPSERDAMAGALRDIRQSVFQSPTGDIDNVTVLTTDAGQYGSYAGAGYLLSNLNSTGAVTKYGRYLDLDQATARTVWTQDGAVYQRTLFCSNPTRACTQHTNFTSSSSSTIKTLPALTYAFSSALEDGLPAPNVTCLNSNTLQVRGFIADPSMLYEFLVHASAPGGTVSCTAFPVAFGTPPNATIRVTGATKEAWITWVGDTNFDLDAGDEASGFSFRGPDPHDTLTSLLAKSTTPSTSFASILAEHIEDYQSVTTAPFALNLGQTALLDIPTDVLMQQYQIDAVGNSAGNLYIEWLLFNYGRYLLSSSARGVLPTNLQGKWANGIGNAWSADANINIQMNYWSADMTNLDVAKPMFDYLLKNWAPRGAYTAEVLYNITRGWVVHNEIFGHSGMKAFDGGNSAQWMIHVWDYFDYTNDVAWWKSTGWPLLKGVASFHLDNLVEDLHFNDSTLVAAPCNSPEQVPITFGCAHAQQIIWQLFNAVEKGFAASGDTDTKFLNDILVARGKLDRGIHIGSWGQLQEWKVDQDSPTDTHRHLSHLIGLFPGYAVASYDPTIQGPVAANGQEVTYTKQQVLDAAQTSLVHRGNGTGPDADSGWEKAWRAAAYAQLGDAKTFYHMLSRNFAANLFSEYDPFDSDPIFQIDANLAYPSAVMNALLQAPDVPTLDTPLTITLLPALPLQWPKGSIRGARVRGGIAVDLTWSGGKPTKAVFKVSDQAVPRKIQIVYAGKTLASLSTTPGLSKTITSF
ncbi:glycoside hydrolase family 95 protein [Macrolepiota fuliginosa MF-IS2]|uniref:Glycoside hydrolase family 95 protein n=1 Tax=Macrolepiota fuliginosa MF-IS2 TaxID=1400762 RepID=A0A9P5XJK0_9AGAR|nr:glycoside hydrolase family 95 protein [Macrolepiota fuliginosa MF-IS2]